MRLVLDGQTFGSPQTRPEPFLVAIEARGATVIVAPSGEIDIATTGELRSRLRALRADFDRIVLDLRRVSFMGCDGLRLVLEAEAAARSEGRRFQLIQGPAGVRRLFVLAEVDDRLPFVAPDGI